MKTSVSDAVSDNHDESAEKLSRNGDETVEEKAEKSGPQRKASKLMTEEARETGHVGIDVYMMWAKAAGGLAVPIIFVGVFAIVEGMSVLSNWWLTYWSAHGDSGRSQAFFLSIYAGISIATALAGLFRMIFISYFGLRASSKVSNII